MHRPFRALIGGALGLALAGLVADAAHADDYRLGHGYDIGPFNLAGYSNLVLNDPRNAPKSLVLDDLSLFVSGHVGRFINPFVEAEFTGFDIARWDSQGTHRRDGDLVVERIYNDANLTDSLTLRLGKMLSPVGEWNVIHAAPLVLTTVRPAVTFRNFSEHATGVALIYSDPFERFPEVQLYVQPSGEISERPRSEAIHRYEQVQGAHITVPVGLLDKVGFSFQHSRDKSGVDQSLYGIDFHYTIDRLTLQGEGTVSDVSDPNGTHARDHEYGAYAAASYALDDEWSVYGWYEAFADRTAPSAAQDVLAGVAYRFLPASVMRLEYVENVGGAPVNPSGLFASWSVLF